MTTAWSQTYCRMIILMIIVGMLTGCASVFQEIDDQMNRAQFKSDHESLANALGTYDSGDFNKALVQFKALKTYSESAKVANRAWLGEICCLLMLAETPAEYTTAIGMWHDYGYSANHKDSTWELALLDQLVVHLTTPPPPQVVETRLPTPEPAAAPKAPADVQPADLEQKEKQQDSRQLSTAELTELDELKKKAKRTDQLQQRLNQVVAENRSLKEKIKALEAIDQNIQKKKTEISAPSE